MQRAEASPRCLAQETKPDSLADRASLLAARGLVGELRPLYQRAGQTFPPSVRLYCELAIAQADHRWEHVVGCVDSLTTTYSASLDLKGLIALCLLKAETLHRLGRFEAMTDYASERLAYFQGRRVKTSILAPFRSLVKKGRRLSGSDLRTQMLQKVEMGDAYALLQYPDSQIAALDNYARWRCRLLLAVAYNRPDVAASIADSLLFLKADSLDTNDYISCVHTAARVLMVQGRWKDLNRMATKLMQRKKKQIALGTLSASLENLLKLRPDNSEPPRGADLLPRPLASLAALGQCGFERRLPVVHPLNRHLFHHHHRSRCKSGGSGGQQRHGQCCLLPWIGACRDSRCRQHGLRSGGHPSSDGLCGGQQ